ncbi:MAG: CCA tRNA nucleotidyltransferase [bacterium]|nr:CCA tRNA nucleotidyltransferase [bacterium]
MTRASVGERILRHPLAALVAGRAGRSGHPACHAVGGIVRDAVLSVDTIDLDITVASQGGALASSLAEESTGTCIALGGDRFSSYRVVAGDFQVDVWDRAGGGLVADLERRDLTINSIAWGFEDGKLHDPFAGLSDLAERMLRATKGDCFERDPLRVLRLARFHTFLDGFKIDSTTANAARDAAVRLERTAVERVRDELHRTLAADSTHLALGSLSELGALAVLVPETADPSASASLLESAGRLDQYLTLLAAELSEREWRREDRRVAAISLLLAHQSDGLSITATTGLERRGLTTRKTLRAAIRLLADQLPKNEDDRRLFILGHGPHWPLALAVHVAMTPEIGVSAARQLAIELQVTAREHPSLVRGAVPLLDGHAAARILGVAPGPAVGEALRGLVRAQALGLVTTRDEAEDFLRKQKPIATTLRPPSGAD